MKTINNTISHRFFLVLSFKGAQQFLKEKHQRLRELLNFSFFSGIPNSEIYGFRDSVLFFSGASNHPSNIFCLITKKAQKVPVFSVGPDISTLNLVDIPERNDPMIDFFSII